ncbi:MAG: SlyX family protein [Planctomycetes bacterium]|nr:SlyX family protein [Planctomycetota bacterium]
MDERITELEIKMAHVEDHLHALNVAIVRQQGHIENLELALGRLRDRLDASAESGSDDDSAAEKPPHY